MQKFKEIDKRPTSKVEESILNSWGGIKGIYERSLEKNKENKEYVFYDGPAFANGFPGLHHMVAKNLKDTICKYHAMNGKKVLRKVGWDTHGLPIENHVEKKLGLQSKKDIENYGIEAFNQKCRESVRENEAAFVNLTKKMGQFIDVENPYITFKNEYIETEWWILKKFFDEDKKEMLEALGLEESGLDKLIKASYKLLGLMSFLTAGEPEVRAWTIKKGTKAPDAAGKIHSDIQRGFIRAEIVSYNDLINERRRHE